MNYSPMRLALIALGLLLAAIWVESLDEHPTVAGSLTLAGAFLGAGALLFLALNAAGALP